MRQPEKKIHTKPYQSINPEMAKQWKVNSLNILEIIFGNSSNHFIEFQKASERLDYSRTKAGNAVLKAAKDDYEKGFHVLKKKEILVTDVETKPNELETICTKDAKRNTWIYLGVTSLIFFFICSALFYFFGIGITSIITFGLLIIFYFLSALSLKEWTPTKLPERVLELEKNRIYKKFGLDIDKG